MSRRLDRMTRSAVSQRQKLRNSADSDTVADKLRKERSQSKEEQVLVWGPYRDGPDRFRLKISQKGETRNVGFKTREEAATVKADLLAQSEVRQERTIGEAIDGFLHYMAETRCIKPDSVVWTRHHLGWLPSKLQLTSLTAEHAERLYRDQVTAINAKTHKPLAAATHRGRLLLARRVYSWAQKAGLCKQNPFSGVQPVGRENVGKKQLRIDEARRLEAVCLTQARAGYTPAIGALLMMYLGLRQGEVAARLGRDIDDDGRVLWVPSGKTKNAKRRLKIPELLRPLIQELVQKKGPDELLFYPSGHNRFHVAYYHVRVKRLCRLAGVPEVCPHSLRGLHATLALEGGATADAVARALGHGSFAMTERHYASESSVADSRSSRVTHTLAAPVEPMIELSGILKRMPTERLLELLDYLRPQYPAEWHPEDKHQT